MLCPLRGSVCGSDLRFLILAEWPLLEVHQKKLPAPAHKPHGATAAAALPGRPRSSWLAPSDKAAKRTSMRQYVGLDVFLKEISFCVMDAGRSVRPLLSDSEDCCAQAPRTGLGKLHSGVEPRSQGLLWAEAAWKLLFPEFVKNGSLAGLPVAARIGTNLHRCACPRISFRGRQCSIEFPHSLGRERTSRVGRPR